ncbi:MAG: potassium-transporting ATPase subunit C [Acidobacteriota bacterium]|nr:potassium-transporting ATPase subunit C [Acidobacteriota bacterium]
MAQARGVSPANIQQFVDALTQNRDLGLWGEARVNVLKLNLTLDRRFSKKS